LLATQRTLGVGWKCVALVAQARTRRPTSTIARCSGKAAIEDLLGSDRVRLPIRLPGPPKRTGWEWRTSHGIRLLGDARSKDLFPGFGVARRFGGCGLERESSAGAVGDRDLRHCEAELI